MKHVLLVSAVTLTAGLAWATPPEGAKRQDTEMQVGGEASRQKSQAATPQWRSAEIPRSATAKLSFRELPASRVRELHLRNERNAGKRTQLGIARQTATEATAALPALQWRASGPNGAAARIEIASPGAVALRAGLQLHALPANAELRFAGSDEPGRVSALVRGSDALGLADAERVFWTPTTDGASQIIEIYVPDAASARRVRLQVPSVSHLLTGPGKDFVLKGIGDSGSCNVDTVCRVASLGTNFVNAKNAVARMLFVDSGGAYTCTGTLLNDTVTSTQIPYFYSAHHCISSQTVASTLETYWQFEATGCGSGVAAANTQLLGGATYLYSSDAEAGGTDALLLRLNQSAPAGSYFSGWDSATLNMPANVTAIHHPSGDLKKVSLGQQVSSSATDIEVGWTSGTTEGGSSGSGLFTTTASGYFLRGGLYGGYASCANSGSISNPDNRDYYSRFDVVFPNIRAYLAPAGPVVRRRVNDFNGDNKADVLWRNSANGANDIWLSANSSTRQITSSVSGLSWVAVGTGDFNGDKKSDIFWRNSSTGANAIWRSGLSSQNTTAATVATVWKAVGIGDFNGDGKDDVFWRNSSNGTNAIWWSGSATGNTFAATLSNLNWQVVGVGDIDADGKDDVVWRHNVSGANQVWRSAIATQAQALATVAQNAWRILGVADFTGDGKADILWRNVSTGGNVIWLSGNSATQRVNATVADLNWQVVAVGDYDGDGKADVLWRNASTGHNDLWRAGSSATRLALTRVADVNWKVIR